MTTFDPFADAAIARPARNLRTTGTALTQRAETVARQKRRMVEAIAQGRQEAREARPVTYRSLDRQMAR